MIEKPFCALAAEALEYISAQEKSCSYTLPWPPSINTYWRSRCVNGRPIIYVSSEGKKFRESVRGQVESYKARGLIWKPVSQEEEKLGAIWIASPPDYRRRDNDNIEKALFDALQFSEVIPDDRLIKYRLDGWLEPSKTPCVQIAIFPATTLLKLEK